MRAIRVLLLVVFVVGVGAAAGVAQQPNGSQSEPWQISCEKFVEVHNTCIKDTGCDRKRFLDKEVRWVGIVRSIDLEKQPPSIVMDMPGPSLADQNGVGIGKGDLFVFVLNPEASEMASWKAVAKGQRVRFRAKTSGGITGSVVGFSSLPSP
ncbi:MAG: hypothetical protein ACR2M4_06280 [Actinomycetota bacterium]